SIGVIIQYFVGATFPLVDIVTWIMQILLLVVSFIFLGKKFTMHTILATLLYPAFFTLFYRIPAAGFPSIGEFIASQFQQVFVVDGATIEDTALIVLAAIMGGALVGGGVAICYYGDGSTGGFDVISVLIARHSAVKESLSAFIIDGSLVVIGMICMQDLPRGVIGIISALVCALVVQYVYVNANKFVIADVISSEYEKIMGYVTQQMDRTTTVIDATGGYSKQNKKILRVAFSKRELFEFKAFVAEVDPEAFVTFVSASMINGEGFDPLVNRIALPGSEESEEEVGKDGE
ncbi:MAG: YitT family protein, partial [Bacilli bacterium]|nr:YitT family protein [Bacilli bacterium]